MPAFRPASPIAVALC